MLLLFNVLFFFFQAEDGIRDIGVTGVQTCALPILVELLLRILGPQRLPYAFSAALSSIFPAIYVDVQLVLASPLAQSAAPRMGRNGLAMMGGTLTAGILVGYVFVVPGDRKSVV